MSTASGPPSRRNFLERWGVAAAGVVISGWLVPKLLDTTWENILGLGEEPINITAPDWAHNIKHESFSLARTQFVLPLTREQVMARYPGPGTDKWEWAKAVGGVPAAALGIHLTATSAARTVLVEGISIRTVRRRPAMAGVWQAPNGAGDVFRLYVAIDADEALDVYEGKLSNGELTEDGDPRDFPFAMAEQGDVFDIDVLVSAHEVDLEFIIDLQWRDPKTGERGILPIDDSGRPFRVTGVSRATAQFYWDLETDEPHWVS